MVLQIEWMDNLLPAFSDSTLKVPAQQVADMISRVATRDIASGIASEALACTTRAGDIFIDNRRAREIPSAIVVNDRRIKPLDKTWLSDPRQVKGRPLDKQTNDVPQSQRGTAIFVPGGAMIMPAYPSAEHSVVHADENAKINSMQVHP